MIVELLAVTAAVAAIVSIHRERRLREHWASGIEALEAALRGRDLITQQPNPVPPELAPLLPAVKELHADKEALAAQAQMRRLYETIFNELRHGVLVIHADFTIQFANRAVAVLFPGTNIQSRRRLIEELREHELNALAHEALEGHATVSRHIRRLTDKMEEHVYFAEAAPLPGPPGSGVWILIEDVTDRHMTEQIRRDFVANASHELRTPLTMINGYIETLQDGLLDNPEFARRSLDVMEKHGKRIARIVEDMLAISRLESSAALLKIEPFKVRDCVKDVLEHLTPMIEARHPVITLNFPPDGGVLHGDRFYWDQIFTNLIENAIKENARSGLQITVTGEWRPDAIVLTVADNGVGIAAHDLPFVFKRFYRGAKHHSQEIKGTGLGLSIVKRAIEAHGGKVELRSTPGTETVFTMTLPAAQPVG